MRALELIRRWGSPRWIGLAALLVASGCSSSMDNAAGSAGLGGDSGSEGEESGDSDSGPLTSGASDDSASSGGGTSGGDPSDSSGEPEDQGAVVVDALDRCEEEAPTIELVLRDSNATASAVLARMAVLGGWASPGGIQVRPWEILAYYPFSYPAAPAGEVAVHAEMRAADGGYELQVGVVSSKISAEQRPPLDLTLLLDVSSSMKGLPLTLLKRSCLALAGRLRKGDRVAVVTLSSAAPVLLPQIWVKGADDPALVAAIEGLSADGGEDLAAGLAAAYSIATAGYSADRLSRVLLISDGGAAADEGALGLIEGFAAAGEGELGTSLIGVGVGGYGAYVPDLMDSVSAAGQGASIFIGSEPEAAWALGENFLNVMALAARDVRVWLMLPQELRRAPPASTEKVSVWAQAPLPLPQNDALVYHARLESCEAPPADDAAVTVMVSYRDPYDLSERSAELETTVGALLKGSSKELGKGAALLAYAEALALWGGGAAPESVAEAAAAAMTRVDAALKATPGDPGLIEVEAVLAALLKQLQG